MQQTADFFQQTSKVLTVSELTRSIRGTLSIVMSTEVETSLDISEIVRDSSTPLGMTKTHAPCR
jgi:hypothetical protein